eukprot:2225569-Alexandrium_andersonii.AAC.1
MEQLPACSMGMHKFVPTHCGRPRKFHIQSVLFVESTSLTFLAAAVSVRVAGCPERRAPAPA